MQRVWFAAFLLVGVACDPGPETTTVPPATPENAVKLSWQQHSPPETARSCVDAPLIRDLGTPGHIDPTVLSMRVKVHHDAIRRCYDARVERNPALHGRVTMHFVIDPRGAVTDAAVTDNQIADCEVTACIRSELRTAVFPAPEGGSVPVGYAVTLAPANTAVPEDEDIWLDTGAPPPAPGRERHVQPFSGPAPTACLEKPRLAAEWQTAAAHRVEQRLGALASCSEHLSKAGEADFTLALAPDGHVKGVQVSGASTEDCRALECLSHGLATLALPQPPGGYSTLYSSVSLAPGRAPERIENAHLDAEHPSHCVPAREKHISGRLPPDQIHFGRLPPDQIQSVVRSNYDAFRACYEAGLARDPNLTGRFSARFVINRDGTVSNVGDGGSNIRDCDVIECLEHAFTGIKFPPPEGGVVTVVYPIMLEPG